MNMLTMRSQLGFELIKAQIELAVADVRVDIAGAANNCRTALGVGNTIIQCLDIDVLQDRVFDAELLVDSLSDRVHAMDQCYWPEYLPESDDPLLIRDAA